MHSTLFPSPDGAAVGAGCGRLRSASITFSPRAPHALVFLFCLLVAARQAVWQLRGSRTPHSSVHSGCSLLHGYRQFCPAICWESAELPAHWLSEEKNTASIGCREVSGCCDWSGSTAPAPWRLGLCKHPGCFFQWSVFTSSSVLPVCADWGWVSLRSRESGESEANWLPAPPYALWLKKHSALLWHFWQHYRRGL